MKPSAYPSYKSSGVDWLGDIPQDWDVKRLKFSATINDEALAETTPPDFEFEYVDISSVNSVDGITTTEHLAFDTAPSRARRRVRHGDTIVSTVRTYLRAIAPIKHPPQHLIVSTGFAVVRPRNIDPPFMAYALRESAFVESVVSRSVGVSYPAVNASELGDISIPIPGLAEQQAIAHFLDHETGRIDRLVAKKRELIERLKEKRSAMISRTVTRGLPPSEAAAAGLDPSPSLKASDVEWLGDVPKHWEIKQLKWAIMFQRGHDLPSDEREDGTVPLVTSAGISAFVARAAARGPGIVTGRYGTIGDFYLIEEDYWPLNTTLYSIELRENHPAFLRYMLMHLAPLFLLNAVKSAVPGVDRNDIHSTTAAVPPPGEQVAIATFLDEQMAKLDTLAAKVHEAIERLQEYRIALITAAVTGKIDVRKATA